MCVECVLHPIERVIELLLSFKAMDLADSLCVTSLHNPPQEVECQLELLLKASGLKAFDHTA